MASLKQVNKAIQAKYPDIFLVKGEGYFYIASDEPETGLMLAGLYTTSIYEGILNNLTCDKWVKEVGELLDQK